MSLRYALYFLPAPDSALDRLGRAWLDALPAALTVQARFYGFHATLKAPFRLADGRDEAQLRAACRTFADNHPPVTAPPLALSLLGGFFALRPSAASPALDTLAAHCVRDFDPFRAPLNQSELAKRLRAPLDDNQRALLERWGYPYVLDQFRFHLTLTDPLPIDQRPPVQSLLEPLVAEACARDLRVDALCLVRQAPEQVFTLVERFTLEGACAS